MEVKHNNATPQRPTGTRPLDAALIPIDVLKYIEEIKNEEAYAKNGKNAITVFKTKQATLTIIALQANENIHTGNDEGLGVMILQVLDGLVHFEGMGEEVVLKTGAILTLNQQLSFSVRAIKESICLLTMLK